MMTSWFSIKKQNYHRFSIIFQALNLAMFWQFLWKPNLSKFSKSKSPFAGFLGILLFCLSCHIPKLTTLTTEGSASTVQSFETWPKWSHLDEKLLCGLDHGGPTLPKTKIALKIGNPKRKRSYSNHPFSGAFAVSFREGGETSKICDFQPVFVWGNDPIWRAYFWDGFKPPKIFAKLPCFWYFWFVYFLKKYHRSLWEFVPGGFFNFAVSWAYAGI